MVSKELFASVCMPQKTQMNCLSVWFTCWIFREQRPFAISCTAIVVCLRSCVCQLQQDAEIANQLHSVRTVGVTHSNGRFANVDGTLEFRSARKQRKKLKSKKMGAVTDLTVVL